MTENLWICPAPPPACITDECPHAIPHKHEPSCKIGCGYCDQPCIKIEEEIKMKIGNSCEAKAFHMFLTLEKRRHEKDIEQINNDLDILTEKWGFYFLP